MRFSAILRSLGPRGAAGPIAGPLGRQLLFWFLVLSLSPLVVSNAVGYFRSETIIYGLVDRYLDGIANVQALHVRDQLITLELALKEMAARDEVMAVALASLADPESKQLETSAVLERLVDDHSAFEALYLFSDVGKILASAPLAPMDLGIWIGPPLGEPTGLVEVARESQAPGYPHVRLASPVPIDGAAGERVFLGGSISVSSGRQFLQIAEHTAGSVETFVLDRDGRPVFVSHPHGHVDYRVRLDTPLLDPSSGSSTTYLDRQGVEVLGTIVPVPGLSWQIVNEVPLSDALQELRVLRRLSLWLGVLLAVLVLGFAWFTAARIVAPVRRLVSATRRLGAGDLGARVRVLGQNEIGELGMAFNDMAGELARTSARVEELHHLEMERAGQLATVGELAAGVAHEIKNPVAGISGGMDLVMRRVRGDRELGSIVDEMRRQISRIEVAVRDLLAFARPADPELAPTNLNATLERVLTLVRPAMSKADVEIILDLAPDLPDVLVDEGLIRQALVNLIVNGIQATSAGGRVDVTTEAVAGGVELRIQDTGTGIAEEQLQRIFKPFFTTKHRGTGLGLSITRSIIDRHHGSIAVESTLGEGTLFTVLLPFGDDGGRHGDGPSDDHTGSEVSS